jgi:hypothetical protein
MSGAAVVARAWGNYKDGQICAEHPEDSPRYYGCLSGITQLVLLSITRFSAGCVLAALFIVFFTKVSQQCTSTQQVCILTMPHMQNAKPKRRATCHKNPLHCHTM